MRRVDPPQKNWLAYLIEATSIDACFDALELLYANNGKSLKVNIESAVDERETLDFLDTVLPKLQVVCATVMDERHSCVFTTLLQYKACSTLGITMWEYKLALNEDVSEAVKPDSVWKKINETVEKERARLMMSPLQSSLEALKKQIKMGCELLENKINQLHSDEPADQKKITILKAAMGEETSGETDNLRGLLHKMESLQYPFKIEQVRPIFSTLHHIVENKVIKPLDTYHEERSWVTRVQEWLCDSTKKLFGMKPLSTRGTLFDVSNRLQTVFGMEETKINKTFGS